MASFPPDGLGPRAELARRPGPSPRPNLHAGPGLASGHGIATRPQSRHHITPPGSSVTAGLAGILGLWQRPLEGGGGGGEGLEEAGEAGEPSEVDGHEIETRRHPRPPALPRRRRLGRLVQQLREHRDLPRRAGGGLMRCSAAGRSRLATRALACTPRPSGGPAGDSQPRKQPGHASGLSWRCRHSQTRPGTLGCRNSAG